MKCSAIINLGLNHGGCRHGNFSRNFSLGAPTNTPPPRLSSAILWKLEAIKYLDLCDSSVSGLIIPSAPLSKWAKVSQSSNGLLSTLRVAGWGVRTEEPRVAGCTDGRKGMQSRGKVKYFKVVLIAGRALSRGRRATQTSANCGAITNMELDMSCRTTERIKSAFYLVSSRSLHAKLPACTSCNLLHNICRLKPESRPPTAARITAQLFHKQNKAASQKKSLDVIFKSRPPHISMRSLKIDK